MKRELINRASFDLKNIEKFDKFLNSTQSDSFKVYPKNAVGDDPAELLVYETVGKDPWTGEGINARDVAGFLADNKGKAVNVKINSPGGLVYDGITIYGLLIAHDGPVTTIIEGIAASVASIIAMAGDTVRMSAVGSMKVHRAWGFSMGNEAEMDDCAGWLRTIDNQLAAVYAGKTGRKAETMKNYMIGKVDGTLFDAQSALDAKFIDEIIPVRGDKKNSSRNEAQDRERIQSALANERRIKAANAFAKIRLMEIGR